MLSRLGLKLYEKRTSHSSTGSRLHVFRNRFLSNLILQETGKNRTRKQVGSRLQRLRDTCRDPEGSYVQHQYAMTH